MGGTRLFTYDGTQKMFLAFGKGVPSLVLDFDEQRVEVEFPGVKEMETFYRQTIGLLEVADQYMDLRVKIDRIEREKGGERE